MQPVHGYDVRRELVTWRLEEVANVRPGSIYGAIRTLERDGCVAVHSRGSESNRPERTAYVLTAEGEKEFTLLLRQAWWTVQRPIEPLVPALCLMTFMSRDELVRALQARITALESELEASSFVRSSIVDGATGAEGGIPEHVREIFDFTAGRSRAEITWARAFIRRIRAGAYHFAGDPDFPRFGPGLGAAALGYPSGDGEPTEN